MLDLLLVLVVVVTVCVDIFSPMQPVQCLQTATFRQAIKPKLRLLSVVAYLEGHFSCL